MLLLLEFLLIQSLSEKQTPHKPFHTGHFAAASNETSYTNQYEKKFLFPYDEQTLTWPYHRGQRLSGLWELLLGCCWVVALNLHPH